MTNSGRALWLTIFILSSLLIGCATVWLSRLSGTGIPGSILAGGGAFGGSLLLFMAIFAFMDRSRAS